MSSLSIGQVAAYRSLTKCGQEELAIHQRGIMPSGGVMFARKPSDEHKVAARNAIIDLLSTDKMPLPITVLSMPGLKWKFEGALMTQREGDNYKSSPGPHRTKFICIENDRSIYHSAVLRVPGLRNEHQLLSVLPSTKFAERTVSSMFIERYYFGNVDDLMRDSGFMFDAAWLDYQGPLSRERVRLIQTFFWTSVRNILVVTSLRARWNRATSKVIDHAGGFSKWLRASLPAPVLHEIEYQDGPSPMTQFAITKERHL